MRARQITESAAAVALAALLSLVKIPLPHLLYGGSVSLEGLPLLLLGLRRGAWHGLLAGACFGLVNLMLRPYVVHPVQLLLDYPVAFGLLGLGAGLLALSPRAQERRPALARLQVGGAMILGNAFRLGAHVVSGMVFFAAYAPAGQPVWLYSLTYNGSYMLPQLVLHILMSQMVLRLAISRQE